MKYGDVVQAVFLSRPNRFVAVIEVDGKEEVCHVKNTGRLKELLVAGSEIFVQYSKKPDRKTAYDLIGVRKGRQIINIDSQIPNEVVKEWIRKGNLFPGLTLLKGEQRFGDSRFDIYVEEAGKRIFLEVKGVTLEEQGVARFPDAPTQRGVKHLQELVKCAKQGYEACIFFVIQMKGVQVFEPNDRTQPAFGQALREAVQSGVKVFAYDCKVTEDSIEIDRPVKVNL